MWCWCRKKRAVRSARSARSTATTAVVSNTSIADKIAQAEKAIAEKNLETNQED